MSRNPHNHQLHARQIVIGAALRDLFTLLGHKDRGDQLATELGHIEANPFEDGRSNAWTPERRKAHGEKVAAAAEARKARDGLYNLLCYRYIGEDPVEIDGLSALAEASGTTAKSIMAALAKTRDGFVVTRDRARPVVFARDEDAFERLTHEKYLNTHHPDDIIRLPAKPPVKAVSKGKA